MQIDHRLFVVLILFDMFVVCARTFAVCAVLFLLLLVCCFVVARLFLQHILQERYVYDFIT